MMEASTSMCNPIAGPQNVSTKPKMPGAGTKRKRVKSGSTGEAGMAESISGGAKNSFPKMPDDMKILITKKVTKEVKIGLNLGQLKVTTTITLLPDQVKFLGPAMTRDLSSGPLKTVLRESIHGIHDG